MTSLRSSSTIAAATIVLAITVVGCATTAGVAVQGSTTATGSTVNTATTTATGSTVSTATTTTTSGSGSSSSTGDPTDPAFCDQPQNIQLRFVAGSMPPPYHYEWTLTAQGGADAGDSGTAVLDFSGGYDAEPTWTERFDLTAQQLKGLCGAALSLRELSPDEEGAVGGSTGSVSIATAAGSVERKLGDAGSSTLDTNINWVIPSSVWYGVQAKYKAYVDGYDQQSGSSSSSLVPLTTSTTTTSTTTRSGPPESTLTADQACSAAQTVELHYSEGTLAPPYHYEWTLTVGGESGTEGSWAFSPSYENDPVWTETFDLPDGAAGRLCQEIADAIAAGGSEISAGGSAGSVTVTTDDGVWHEVIGSAASAQLADDMKNGYIPVDVWDDMFAEFQTYQDDHGN